MNQRSFLAIVVSLALVVSSCTQKPVSPAAHTNPYPVPTISADPADRTPSNEEETPWTTWSEKGSIGAMLMLKDIRENLLKNNLKDPHVHYEGYAPVDCSKINVNFRSADGTCNDVKRPHVGAAGVAFGRNVAPEFIDKDAEAKIMTPNPSLVSKELFTRDEYKEVPFLNMLAAVWIQFMNHDWFTHGPNMKGNEFRFRGADGSEKIVDRTKENPTSPHGFKSEFGRVNANDVTHWWDASQIYGSSQAEQSELRSFSRGKMKTEKVGSRELLPKRNDLNVMDNRQNQGYEATGFKDNWWVGLSMLHLLFVKEHNAIADEIMKKHVQYDSRSKKFIWTNGSERKVLDERGLDEQVFQTARLVNAAVLAKIHTVEWTPAILPNDTLRRAMFTNWYGLANPQSWSPIFRNFPFLDKTDWFSGPQSGYIISGIVGEKTNDSGVPFSITEEFTSVYRLHSLLPESLYFRRHGDKAKVLQVPFRDTRNEKSYPIMAANDMKDLFYSFGLQRPGQLVLNNFPEFMQSFEIPGHPTVDLGLIDIMRDRERGVPRYNQFRRAIGLKPIKTYRDFFPAKKPLDARQQAVLEKMTKVYGKDQNGNDNVEMIDLLVGTLAEEVRPKNFGFGETMFQIFIVMASRRLMADRFFTVDYRKEIYTKAGMNWIDEQGTLGKVIVRHMPELAPNIRGLTTAFDPWKP